MKNGEAELIREIEAEGDDDWRATAANDNLIIHCAVVLLIIATRSRYRGMSYPFAMQWRLLFETTSWTSSDESRLRRFGIAVVTVFNAGHPMATVSISSVTAALYDAHS